MELREQLQASLGATLSIERELGGGGMSRVFVATDPALGRQVVVKVLSPELAAGVSAERFAREIRLAAGLQQANIVPVLSAGETGGLPYFTMPFVQGLSLRQRLAADPNLPIVEVVGILRDVARALAYAHERGIVHRDIKPENVLLSGDAAVVTDFGIAKALSDARAGDGHDSEPEITLTVTGTSMGTPAYMAPEQAAGDPNVDHRADLYSFGCLGYELLAGKSPFHGRPLHRLIAAHMAEMPVVVSELRADCPPAIARLVMQCLEKDVARRPTSAREILQALDQVTTPLGGASAMSRRRVIPAAALGGVVIAATVIALLIRGGAASTTTPASVAVLPFANVGGDSAQAYLADGMSDELTTALGKVPGVQVAARSRTYNYRNRRDVDAREAGRALGVAYVVQGTVRRAGDNRLHVSAQLTSAADGKEVWSEIYDKDDGGLFEVQDEMTRSITARLASPAQQRASASVAVEARGTKDIVAHDLYQRGQFLLERRGQGVRQSVDKFQQAIDRDPLYARAYAGLSEALAFLPYFSATPAMTVDGRAVAAARRALALDSTLASPHIALALAHAHHWQWDSAGIEFRRAVAADSLNSSARTQYGRYLLYTGHIPEARTEFERGRAIDPYSAVASSWLAVSLWLLGERAASMAEFKRALELDSTSSVANNLAANAYIDWGMLDEARRLGDHMPRVNAFAAFAAWIHGKTGDRELPLELAHELEAHPVPRRWFDEWSIAAAYLSVGDTARGLDALERSVVPGEIWPDFVPLHMPLYDPVRSSPRFAAVVRRIGLDVAQATQPRGGRK